MKYSTVIFDLDGTLIDTLGDLRNSVNYTLSLKGFPGRTYDEVKSFVGNGIAKLVSRALPAGTDEKTFEECLAVFRKHYLEHSLDLTAPYPGICETLAELKKAGVKTAVVTNKTEDAAVKIVNHFFGGSIDVTVGQSDALAPKPAPDGVFAAMKKLGSAPEECVYAGDSEVDCATARNAGLPVIGCAWGFRDRCTLENEKADYIIDRPEGIIEIVK